MFSSADSTDLIRTIHDIKDLVSPGWLKYALDICCILSIAISFAAFFKVIMINSSLKRQKKCKAFVNCCSDYLKKLNQKYPPSDNDEKIESSLKTFMNDFPFYFVLQRHRLKKSLKQFHSTQCDKKLLLKNLITDFQKDLIQ